MFRYFQARMMTMLLTTSALLRRTRRSVMRDMRKEQEELPKAETTLKEDMRMGNIDKLYNDLKNVLKTYEREEDDFTAFERNIVVAEARALESLERPEIFFERLQHALPTLPQDLQQRLKPKIEAVYTNLQKLSHLEQRHLQLQYLVTNRQSENLKGTIQGFVLSENDLRTLVDKLFEERREIRVAKKDNKEMVKIESGALNIITQIAEKKAADQQEITKLEKSLDALKTHSDELVRHYECVLDDFSKIFKIFVTVEFKIEKDWNKVIDTTLTALKQTGYPETGEKGLGAIIGLKKATEENIKKHKKSIQDTQRRMSRLKLAERKVA